MDVFSGTGSSSAILANRLSYFLNLNGPSITLDTACSSSLVTVHLACHSLRRRESDMALAGGVNLILSPEMTLALTKAHMMAPEGRCNTFDASAGGYVRGEGCGMLVLKRLSDAVAAGDRILALIRGSAVNHDGRSNGLSAPNGPAQENVIRAALRSAGLEPRQIGYIEAHGTGTRLGDPIEIEALNAVFAPDRPTGQPLVVGSVKTNIGHLESAAGIAGIAKLILTLQHGQIPPHLHLRTVNPLLKLEERPIEIPTAMRPWPQGAEPRRAGVSSFGFGGTNAHVIVEEAQHWQDASGTHTQHWQDASGTHTQHWQDASGTHTQHEYAGPATGDPMPTSVQDRPCHLLTLSARSPQALAELAGRYASFLERPAAVSWADVAYTAAAGRSHFAHRLAIPATSAEEAAAVLRRFLADPAECGICRGQATGDRPPRIAFLFTGQGAQYAGMGSRLYETQPVFREALDRCAGLLAPYLDRPLLSLLDAQAGPVLHQTGYTQPVMFALEYALATLWRSWGIEPAAVMGHSVGEFAAATVAGVLSLEDGLRMIAERARLMQSLPPGGRMAAVFATESQVTAALEPYRGRIAIAALNGPDSIVVSGDSQAVDELLARLEAQGIRSKPLATSHAFHSQRMDPILDALGQVGVSLSYAKPTVDIVSNLTGTLADEHTFSDPCYWSNHTRQPVRFAQGLRALAERGCDVFLEIGPSPTLIGMGQRFLQGDYRWLSSLRSGRDDWQSMLDSLGQLYACGVKVDWEGFDRPYSRRKVALPTYAFQRTRYWSGAAVGQSSAGDDSARSGRAVHPLLGRRVVAAVREQVFDSQMSLGRPAILADHKIQGKVILPGSAYLEMALAASAALHDQPWCVHDMSLVEPLVLGKTPKTVQTIVTPEGPQAASVRIVSFSADDGESEPEFVTHAVGRLAASAEAPREKGDSPHLPGMAVAQMGTVPFFPDLGVVDLGAIRERFQGEARDIAWRKEALRKSGLEPGPTFFWLVYHWTNPQEALGELRAPCEADHAGDYHVHPGLLDSLFQLLGAILPGAGTGIDAYVPMSFERWQCSTIPERPLWALATLTSFDGNVARGNVDVIDGEGRVVARVEGASLHRVSRDWMTRLVAGPLPNWCYELAWIPQPLAEVVQATAIGSYRWLIVDSRDGLGAELATRLGKKGCETTVVPGGDSPECRRMAVEKFLAAENSLRSGIVCLAGSDHSSLPATPGEDRAPDLSAARRDGWGAALDLVQAAAATTGAQPPRLWLVTRGAEAAGMDSPLALAQSPLWGLGRVIATEHPELACVRIDLGTTDRRTEADRLVAEILSAGHEDQIVYRGGQRRVARLRSLTDAAAGSLRVPQGRPYRLEITSRGQLDNVALQPVDRQSPGPGQVEIKVHATGLNFRDVLNVLNMYPGDPGPLGGECAGEIAAVGPGVEKFKPGDAVVGLVPASFASFAVTRAEFVARKPEHLSFEEAATIPICFLTVQHALRKLGRMRPGERLLIHAASGGVGLAAIQIARHLGAEIFATAGSPAKRDYLRSLGIEHVMDSRTLDFADQIREATGGEGVDLVLNSLTGDAIGAGLSVLRQGGRFLELGKTDLWDQSRVDAFRPGAAFFAIALDQMMQEQPQQVGDLVEEVFAEFGNKVLRPLPLRTFPVLRAVDALRHMARAEHIGKIVIQAAESGSAQKTLTLREDATYLVTGGLGGLGLRLTRWLVDRGAHHVVLLGRSGATDRSRAELDALQRPGVEIAVRKCDVGNREDLAAVLAEIGRAMPPLRGVFHLAGVLDDGVLREQNRERFDRVMGAKVQGAWNLHELTREPRPASGHPGAPPLDLFVLFSSAAALLGSPGQGNYAAANAFLDALAHHRRGLNLPALSVNWGSWDEVGMAARLRQSEGQRWAATGIGWIGIDQGMATLERLILEDRVHAAVLPIDWPKFFERIPADSEPAWLAEMAGAARSAAAGGQSGPPELLEKLQSVTPAERLELTVNALRQQAAQVLAMDNTQLPDPRRPFNELGFDSLMGVEFCNRVSRAIGQRLNPAVLFDYSTLESLAGHVLRDLLGMQPAAEEPAPEQPEPSGLVDDVEGMSEEEMNALVTAQLHGLGE
jgi:acyl transferase domain-containing protein